GALAARDRQVEAHELPDRVDAEAARLHRVALEVALEVPGGQAHVELGDDAAAVPGALDRDDAIEHEHRRQRQLAPLPRRILDGGPVRDGQDLLAREGGPFEVLGVPHVRILIAAHESPDPTTASAISSPSARSSQRIDRTDGAPAPPVLPKST